LKFLNKPEQKLQHHQQQQQQQLQQQLQQQQQQPRLQILLTKRIDRNSKFDEIEILFTPHWRLLTDRKLGVLVEKSLNLNRFINKIIVNKFLIFILIKAEYLFIFMNFHLKVTILSLYIKIMQHKIFSLLN
jgi:hypothetical protein